jgi:hypothetical protein
MEQTFRKRTFVYCPAQNAANAGIGKQRQNSHAGSNGYPATDEQFRIAAAN